MIFDSVGLGYTKRGDRIFVHYPKREPDKTVTYGPGFDIGPIPPEYFTNPPNEATKERVAIWQSL